MLTFEPSSLSFFFRPEAIWTSDDVPAEALRPRPALKKVTVIAKASRAEPAACANEMGGRHLLRAWAMLVRMDISSALALVDRLSDAPSAVCRELDLLRAAANALNDRVDEAAAAAAITPHVAGNGHPVAVLLSRLGHWKRRDLRSFGELSPPRTSVSGGRRGTLLTILHLSMEAAAEAEQLRLASAMRLASEALALSAQHFGSRFPGRQLSACVQAELFYEQDQLGESERLLRDDVIRVGAQGVAEGALAWYRVSARVALARGQTAFAVLLLREAEDLGRNRGWGRLVAFSLAERVRVLLAVDRVSDARLCQARLEFLLSEGPNAESAWYIRQYVAISQARLCLSTDTTAPMVDVLREFAADHAQRGERRLLVEAQAILACTLLALEHFDEARLEAIQMLALGAASGLHRTLLDIAPEMRGLLAWIDATRPEDNSEIGELRPYLRGLLAALPDRTERPLSARSRHRSGETLSARERHVTRLISQGLSNKRIAKELGIAPETVKSHAKHILLKLGAQTRVEAVSRAMILGIL